MGWEREAWLWGARGQKCGALLGTEGMYSPWESCSLLSLGTRGGSRLGSPPVWWLRNGGSALPISSLQTGHRCKHGGIYVHKTPAHPALPQRQRGPQNLCKGLVVCAGVGGKEGQEKPGECRKLLEKSKGKVSGSGRGTKMGRGPRKI